MNKDNDKILLKEEEEQRKVDGKGGGQMKDCQI